ncbi:MAG: NAD(P)H-dependent oxidoreductase [Desulfosarcinaceae bacterium]
MKVIAVNSSPRSKNESMTELMLTHLVEGMRTAGAEVETINLRDKKIKSCIGCFTCWTKSPGKCMHKDDMTNEIFSKYLAADIAVHATPLYFHTMNGAMSRFRERTLPIAQPFLEIGDDGKTYHPLRHKAPAQVWVSVCGFPELSEFDALSDYLNRTKHRDVQLLAEIYRPAASMMNVKAFKNITNDILNATERAGRELVEKMEVSAETMERIRQPIVELDLYSKIGNEVWNSCIAAGVTPITFREKEMVPRPESIDTFMLYFASGLNTNSVGDRKAILQIDFSEQIEESCYFTIESGSVATSLGKCEQPDIIIKTPFELWMDIMTKKADGQQMFMEQRYAVEGDLNLMIALFKKEDEQDN